jgi:hypothetical protein
MAAIDAEGDVMAAAGAEGARPKKSLVPTNKWIAARVTALAGLIILFITTDTWDDEEWIALVTLVSEAIVSYLVSNTDAPGGVRPAQ